jgi:mono/diheme cytochrome c family protein
MVSSKKVWLSANSGFVTLLVLAVFLAGCDKKETPNQGAKASAKTEIKAEPKGLSKGVGPIQNLELGPIDEALVAKGEKIFSGTCSACHKMDTRYVGPAISGVTKRRSPEWIMNMILNPTVMTQQDDTAKAMLATYMTQMSVNSTEEEARAVLEFFRKHDGP